MVLREKLAPGQLLFMLQATINRLSGPDFLVKMAHGFAFIELKSLKSAGRQFGISVAQDNMTQSITGLVRMYKNGGGVDDLEGAANRFTGLFVHLVDLDYLARHVSDRSRAIFDYAGCVVRVPPEATANLPPEKLSRLVLLADDSAGGTLVFETFESWQMAAKLLDEDGFKRAAQEAMKLQAEDIFNTITALTDKTILSNVLSSTADPQRAERTARLFAHIINEARPKGTPKVRMEDLRGPGGAQIVYDRLGLADNWWDTFTRSVPDAPPFNLEVKVMDIEELRTMSAADFGAPP
nr:hypothetical protein [uncultured Celeribacter sp.]